MAVPSLMIGRTMESGDPRSSDAALLARVAEGDERAFRTIYDVHHRRLFRVAYGVLLDEAGAREAVQEAFLELHRTAAKWEPRATVGTWLFRVVLNHSLGLRQRLARLFFAPAVAEGGTRASPERAAAMSESVVVIERSLAAMSAKQRAVAMLFLEAELAPQEIAGVVGMTPNAARVTLHRALTRLREDLKAAGIDSPEDDPTFAVLIDTEEN